MLLNTPHSITKWQNRYNKNSDLYIAEGDSWFDYPGEKSNIINGYSLIDILSEKIDVLNFAHFGDTIKNISREENIKYIKDRLSYILHSDPKKSKRIKGFLISAGGNDLIDNLSSYINNLPNETDYKKYINYEKLNELLNDIHKNYVQFIKKTKEFLNEDIKFVLHTYDYITNLGDGFNSWFTDINPWIWPKMQKKGIQDKQITLKIMEEVINMFFETLINISKTMNNIYVIDLRGTIKDSKLFENEIHLSKDGMKELVNNTYYKKLIEIMR